MSNARALEDLFGELITLDSPLASKRVGTPNEGLNDIANRRGTDPTRLRNTIRGDLDWIVASALARERDERYQSALGLAEDVKKHLTDQPISVGRPTVVVRLGKFLRRHRVTVTMTAGILVALIGVVTALIASLFQRLERIELEHRMAIEERVRDTDIPEIHRLLKDGYPITAFDRLQEAKEILPDDASVKELIRNVMCAPQILSDPPGAQVYIQDSSLREEQSLLGNTPITSQLPRGVLRFRFEKDGYQPVERLAALEDGETLSLIMDRADGPTTGMVRIHKGEGPRYLSLLAVADRATLIPQEFFIDKYEVSNAAYQAFVDSGAYVRFDARVWKELEEDFPESWKDKLRAFRDASGAPGPSTWHHGNYSAGKERHPVSGVSWYEAAAYARFRNKSLPTIHHWGHAADFGNASKVAPLSNLNGSGPSPVGTYPGFGYYGVYDLAGNVREWCINEGTAGTHCALGGAWHDPEYAFAEPEVRPSLSRNQDTGFRCASYPNGTPPPESLQGISNRLRDFASERGFSSEELSVAAGFYQYPQSSALRENVSELDFAFGCRHIRIELDAAYDDERLIIHLFLPPIADKPLPVAIFFPGRSTTDKFKTAYASRAAMLVQKGWGVAIPIYKGMFERRGDVDVLDYRWNRPLQYRELVIKWRKDIGRTIDYLGTRDDLRLDSLTYFGTSLGAAIGPVMIATEKRFRAAFLSGGGLYLEHNIDPAVDPFMYLQHVHIPVLMVNGKFDLVFPLHSSQLPMFELLGTNSADKRHVIIDANHVIRPYNPVIELANTWLRTKIDLNDVDSIRNIMSRGE